MRGKDESRGHRDWSRPRRPCHCARCFLCVCLESPQKEQKYTFHKNTKEQMIYIKHIRSLSPGGMGRRKRDKRDIF